MAALISFILLCTALVSSPLIIAIGGARLIREDDREIENKKARLLSI
ncbi:hypothetical protein [Paenibacillus sp. Soil766]|nr:hypothetical protein [Paenibacillus sp. Soil766]